MMPSRILVFGPFELDGRSGDLRKHGLRIRLADQPRTVLALLIERQGEIVSREDIRQRLWPADTFVDFDAGLSSTVRKLREALGDSAEHPRFIETVPRRGYRFIATVSAPAPAAVAESAPLPVPVTSRWQRTGWTAAALLVALAAVMVLQIASRPRVNAEANEAFLKGVAAMGRENVAGFRTAVAYFEQATVSQPDFAMAYARLAHAQLQLVYAGQFAPRDIVPRADAAVRKALALDDTIPLAHRTRAAILHNYFWEWEAGDREIQRALQLDGTSVEAHTQRALALAREGRFEEAIAEAQRARAADALSASAALSFGEILRAAGQFDGAIAEFRHALAINPQMARGEFQLGVTYALMDRWSDAIGALDRAVRITPDNSRFLAYLGFAYAKAGRTAEARAILEDLKVRSREHYVSSFGLALIHDALGERDAAVAALERAYEDHALEFAQWKQYPALRSAAVDPRYQVVLRRVARTP
jgi:DNA-binding winged helix-turn-helix (wHTH) protein/tetratricopeptide (TPR) repeat protein